MLHGCTRDLLQQRCNAWRKPTPTLQCDAQHTASQFVPKLASLNPWARVPAQLLAAPKTPQAEAASARAPAAVQSRDAGPKTPQAEAASAALQSRDAGPQTPQAEAASARAPAAPAVQSAAGTAVQKWQRVAHLALALHAALAHVFRAFRTWRKLWARAKRVHLLTTASGLYCYELPELAVIAATAADGASELANEYCVLKVGMTQCAGGGFLNRLRTEMRDIEHWRDSAKLGLEQRLVFLLTGDGACGHERRVLGGLGVRIGVAPVDRVASAATLRALAVAEPGAGVEDALFNNPSRLKVQNGWRLWLSGRTRRCAVGPSEFLVVHRAVVARLRRKYTARPGRLHVESVLACAAELRGARLRCLDVDFVHHERSLGKLVFALQSR